jgi:hypothetical protein
MPTVSLVAVPNIDAIWPLIASGVEQSVQRCDSDLTAAYLWQLCRSGTGFLIVAVDENNTIQAFTIHRFEPYRSGMKFCCLATWGPGIKRWFNDMKAVATIIAKAGGANAFITEGSDAYLRLLPGAKKVRTLIEVPFDG